MKSDKIVPKIRLLPKFGACPGGNSENGMGNIFPTHYKECSLVDGQFHKNVNPNVKILFSPYMHYAYILGFLDK